MLVRFRLFIGVSPHSKGACGYTSTKIDVHSILRSRNETAAIAQRTIALRRSVRISDAVASLARFVGVVVDGAIHTFADTFPLRSRPFQEGPGSKPKLRREVTVHVDDDMRCVRDEHID